MLMAVKIIVKDKKKGRLEKQWMKVVKKDIGRRLPPEQG